MKKLTIREIAKMANVSPTTVSFVLNNKAGISEDTRKKVTDIIKQTNFKPSLNSRRLYFKRSFNITIVIKQTSSPFNDLFYFEITKGILEANKDFGYNIVFTDMSTDNHMELPAIIQERDTDGILFYQDTSQSILNKIEELGIPYVVVDAHTPNNKFTSINVDYESSSYIATKYLIDNGHTNIAYIGSSFVPDFYVQTFNGFKNALQEAGLSITPSWIQIDSINEQSSYNCMETILSNKRIPSAVFCTVDLFAISAIRCAKDYGYSIPRDISFIGIDDILLSRYIEPQLTTVRIDELQMGKLALEMLVKKINGQNVNSITLKMDKIIIRDSVRSIR